MTDRLPFDPSKMAAAKGSAQAPLTVSQLAGRIGAALASGFSGPVRVIGQVSGFRERTHWYFDLKDAGAVVNCVMFSAAARRLRFAPENGHEVVVTGRVEFYDKAGKVSLLAERIEPVGAGALELAFRAMCEEIRALGWFEAARKRPVPTAPRRIAVVTSRSGAALQDVLDTMRRRCAATDVLLVDVRVQGDGAADEVADALRWLGRNARRLAIEAILVTRGGGSAEDLWAFNERIVAEAIVQSPVPVVAAIGHETDTTIAELVADVRAATPTQAAMRLTPDRAALLEQLDSLGRRMRSVMARRLAVRRHVDSLANHLRLAATGRLRARAHALERLSGRLESFKPAAVLARRAAQLESIEQRLPAAMRQSLAQTRLRLDAALRHLTVVGPKSVLGRGFSYTLREDGRLVRAPGDVEPGDKIRTVLADGEVLSVVDGAPEAKTRLRVAENRPSAKPPARTPRQAHPDQMDLFKPSR
jgi:exodeoxyribonuclease VII large subunit